jgi:hypothetical protein
MMDVLPSYKLDIYTIYFVAHRCLHTSRFLVGNVSAFAIYVSNSNFITFIQYPGLH